MGICDKCEEPCDGEPYVMLVDGAVISNRQYCVRHAPPLHMMEQKEIGHTLTGAVITVTVEWVRGSEVLDTPHQFRSQDYKAGWRDGNAAYMRSMTDTTDATEYDEWNPPDEAEQEAAEDYQYRQSDPDDD